MSRGHGPASISRGGAHQAATLRDDTRGPVVRSEADSFSWRVKGVSSIYSRGKVAAGEIRIMPRDRQRSLLACRSGEALLFALVIGVFWERRLGGPERPVRATRGLDEPQGRG